MAEITITESAAERIKYLASTEKDPHVKLRVAVLGGGCSGFQYKFSFDATQNDDDILIDFNDETLAVIDATSLPLIKGSQIDFVQNLTGSSFQITNPNAQASCGCGNSFAL